MCLKSDNNDITEFMPSGRPDPDTDKVPLWVEAVSIEDICLINVERLPIIKSNGICLDIKKGDEYFLCHRDQVKEGDYVAFNGERTRARAISIDS